MHAQVEARADVDVPEFLISESDLSSMLQQHQPRYVPLDGPSSSASLAEVAASENNYDDPSQGILQLKLSNGIRINARRTLNEPKAAMLRMVAAGEPPVLLAPCLACPLPPPNPPTLALSSVMHFAASSRCKGSYDTCDCR